ncbi:MAG: FHA domain-containing protein, partial [Acidobacteria bacterium]
MSWQVQVEVTRDGRRHLRASFERSPITFGARPDNDVVLADPHVSGLHAVVMVSRAELVVQDESRNGSFVGERRIVGQHQLGRHGVLRIPPFAIELTFEPGDEQRQTVQRRVEPPAEGPGAAPAAADGEPATPSLAELSLVHDAPPSAAPESPHATVAVRELTDEPPPAVLEVISGPEHLVGQCFELPVVGAAEIGRSEEADVRIADRTVSRLHAVITRQRDGGYRISDLDSANGVLVDGRRVRFAALHDGDAITVGQVVLTLRWPTLLASGTAGDQP